MSANTKEALKTLKAERSTFIEKARQRVKEQNQIVKKIKTAMTQGPATIPDIAESAAISTRDALWYVTALKNYGQIEEGAKAGSYFTYKLVAGKESDEGPEATN